MLAYRAITYLKEKMYSQVSDCESADTLGSKLNFSSNKKNENFDKNCFLELQVTRNFELTVLEIRSFSKIQKTNGIFA